MSEVRLIDANAIISFVDAGHLRNPLELAWSDNDVVDMIESRPTVDVVAVRHGKWIIRENAWGTDEAKCSECGFEMLVNEPGNGLRMVNELLYCPHCGTKMDGTDGEREPANGYGVMAARMLE